MNIKEKINKLFSGRTLLNDHDQRLLLKQGAEDPVLTNPEHPVNMTYQTAGQEGIAELKEKIVEQLRNIYDPEIPANIYELGLIYALNIDTEYNVDIHMTLTAPGCPVASMIIRQVETKVSALPEINKVTVELVWDPPWTEDMMTDEAKLEVGIL